VRVSADGYIRLPMLKGRIKAAGLMPAELEGQVTAALRAEDLVVDPFVTVNIAEYHSRPINVAGAVRTPLTFQASTSVTLLEAITRAGGFSPDAGPDILVTVASPVDGDPPIARRIPVKALLEGADPSHNITLNGGEEIRVPEAGKVYIVGNVRKPGAYSMQGSETSVLKMLALAEGLAPYAGKQAYVYRREGGNAGRNEVVIELSRIMKRESPDAQLQANDVLYIPDNKGRRLGLAAIEKVLLFGSTAGATALIYGAR
jgi:polysaccharide export outer membrane protein